MMLCFVFRENLDRVLMVDMVWGWRGSCAGC